jgi:hypothetical protein
MMKQNTCNFCSNSPPDVSSLMDELKRAQKSIKRLTRDLKVARSRTNRLKTQKQKLLQKKHASFNAKAIKTRFKPSFFHDK